MEMTQLVRLQIGCSSKFFCGFRAVALLALANLLEKFILSLGRRATSVVYRKLFFVRCVKYFNMEFFLKPIVTSSRFFIEGGRNMCSKIAEL